MFWLTRAKVVRVLTLQVRLAIREELRRLCNEHDAYSAALSFPRITNTHHETLVEFTGDIDTLPSPLVGAMGTVCEQCCLPCRDRTVREVLLTPVRLEPGETTLVLHLVDARDHRHDVLHDDMEDTAALIERIIVDALEPRSDKARAAPTRP